MKRIHELKIHPEPFRDVKNGIKNFEYRKNDRDYQVGDVLRLKEYLPEIGEYTGEEVLRVVTYKLDGGYGLPEEYCILSIKENS